MKSGTIWMTRTVRMTPWLKSLPIFVCTMVVACREDLDAGQHQTLPTSSESDGCAAKPLHRYWSSRLQDHFHTIAPPSNLASLGYVDQGVEGCLCTKAGSDRKGLQRYWAHRGVRIRRERIWTQSAPSVLESKDRPRAHCRLPTPLGTVAQAHFRS